jgi:hypothetical protein
MYQQLFILLKDGYLHKSVYLYRESLGPSYVHWEKTPKELIEKHGKPIARFIVNYKQRQYS